MRIKIATVAVGFAIGAAGAAHAALALPVLLEVSLAFTTMGILMLIIWWAKGGTR
jgi:hypothetical protein